MKMLAKTKAFHAFLRPLFRKGWVVYAKALLAAPNKFSGIWPATHTVSPPPITGVKYRAGFPAATTPSGKEPPRVSLCIAALPVWDVTVHKRCKELLRTNCCRIPLWFALFVSAYWRACQEAGVWGKHSGRRTFKRNGQR